MAQPPFSPSVVPAPSISTGSDASDAYRLGERRATGRPLPLGEALPILKSVAGALQAAHGRGVIHRELTAGNIFLATAEGHEQGFVKLLNFGVARLRSASGGGDVGIAPEAARTMAPEQAQGRSDLVGAHTD